MALIAITASREKSAARYAESIAKRDGACRILTPDTFESVEQAMDGVSGLLLSGGVDVDPKFYGETPAGAERTWAERDEMEFALLRHAIAADMPVLGICRGMQLINVAMGGKLIQDLEGHKADDEGIAGRHPVYVSPGSKLGAIIGAGAVYKTNSLHHQGLKEAQRAPVLMASAYHPDDGIVEALESPEHPWLIGVQCHPERESEVPKSFLKLFEWLTGWAERYETGDMPQ